MLIFRLDYGEGNTFSTKNYFKNIDFRLPARRISCIYFGS